RLGVAQALLHRPSLLILDEPTNGLDPAGIRELRDYLYTLTRKEGISVLVSSHLLSEMELMCDRVAIIQAGKVVEVQTIKDLMNEGLQSSVLFEVDNLDGALQILADHPIVQAKKAEGELDCWLEREQITLVTEALIKQGIKIYGIRKNAQTLEDKFLKITGGEKIG
ncbi:AAA family ATPase, partial [Paenibacillus sp. TAF58]